tara:strand:- start:12875 stop:14086 length:1212 start_codon:yes stop_codon:yes gene_type:complete
MDDVLKSKPVILFNTHVYPRHKDDHVAPFMHDLAKVCLSFARVVVHCPHAPGLPLQEMIEGVEIRRFTYAKERNETLAYRGDMHKQVKKSIGKAFLFYSFLRKWKRATKKLVQEINPDIVHAHWLIPGGYVTRKALGKEPPLFMSMHGTDVFLIDKMRIAQRLAKKAIHSAHNLHFVSEELRSIVERRYGDVGGRDFVLPMVFGLESFSRAASKPRETKRILFVGRLMEVKGVDVLIKAFSKFLENDSLSDYALDIVGDGPELDSLLHLARQEQIEEKIVFHGSKQRNEIADFYANADLFVLPSKTTALGEKEGLGLVVLEAMMSGVPVIGTDCGGIKETIEHGKTGIIVAENDVDALHMAMVDLIQDVGKREQFSHHAHAEVTRKYSSESLVTAMKQWYGVD